MPAPRTDVDESGIATRVALQGIRPTAKATGLPVSTVRDIAKRQGVKAPEIPMQLVPALGVTKPLPGPHTIASTHPSAQPAHQVITDELSTRGANSRLNAARIADTSLAEIAAMEPERMIAALEAANQAGSLAQKGNVPGWERQPQSTENHSHLHLHQHLRPDQDAP